MELIALEGFADIALKALVEVRAFFGEAIRTRLAVVHLAAKGHQGAEGVTLGCDILIDGQLPAHRFLTRTHNHHGLGLAIQQGFNELNKVLHDDRHLLGDVVGVKLHPTHQLFEGSAALHLFFTDGLAFLG